MVEQLKNGVRNAVFEPRTFTRLFASPTVRPMANLGVLAGHLAGAPAELPHGPPIPALAQTVAYMTRPIAFIEECHRRYGDIFTLNTLLFGVEVLVVQPDVIKQIFTGDPDVYRAGEANAPLGALVGLRSLLLLDGAEHIRHRRLLMPPFHGERMLAYAKIMRSLTEAMVARFPRDRAFTLHEQMQGLTLDIILPTVFGVDEGEASSPLREALPRVLDRLKSPVTAVALAPGFQQSFYGLSPWDGFQRDLRRADALVHDQIARRRREAATDAEARPDVLAMMLAARDEAGQPLTETELRDELMTLLVAGHETTATMLCWAVDMILAHPEVHRRLVDELERADDPATSPYLEAVIKEVLRLRPVVPAVGRKLSADVTLAGHRLPAGTVVVPSVYLTHRLQAYYPEPDRFLPDRFLDKKVDPYAWLPFGGGTRRCIGIAFAVFELKVVLATLFTKARLRKVDPGPAKVRLRGFTLVPGDGAEVVAERA